MSTVFIAKSKNLSLVFGSDYNRKRFLDFLEHCEKENKEIRIELAKNPVSDDMRGYWFGAVIPTVRAIIPEWKNNSDNEVHEALRKMFNFIEMFNPLTKRNERFGMSIMGDKSNTKRGMEVIEKIRVWLGEEYNQELPSVEDYQKVRDSAPLNNK